MKTAESKYMKCDNCTSMIPKDRAVTEKKTMNVNIGYGTDIMPMIEYRCPICNTWLFTEMDHDRKTETMYTKNIEIPQSGLKLPDSVIADFEKWLHGKIPNEPKVKIKKPEGISPEKIKDIEKMGDIIPKIIKDIYTSNMRQKPCVCIDNPTAYNQITIYGPKEELSEYVCDKCGGIDIRKVMADNSKHIMSTPVDTFKTEPMTQEEKEKMNKVVSDLKDIANDPKYRDINPCKVPMCDRNVIPLTTVKPLETNVAKAVKSLESKMETYIEEQTKPKGTVIVIEGTDGSGKRTQAEILLNKLLQMGVKASLYSFPNYDKIQGQIVKRYLNGEFKGQPTQNHWNEWYRNASLYSTDRLVTCMEKQEDGRSILEKYEDGEVIIFDRYTQSNFIHQGCHIDNEEELVDFIEDMSDLEYHTWGLPEPDSVIYLRVSPEMSMQNIEKRGNEKDMHENLESLTKANKHTDFLISWLGWNPVQCSNGIANADTGEAAYYMNSRENIHSEVYSIVEKVLVENNQLRHIKYCTECLKADMYNVVKIKSMINNPELKIGVCPICGAIHDITKM